MAALDFKKESKFLVCIDSDGCVFDNMEIKHKECFTPNFINSFNLQYISKYAREVWEYVNLYSKTRGTNRFFALINALNLLETRACVRERGYKAPDTKPLEVWTASEDKLGNATLGEYIKTHSDAILKQAFDWSEEVNATIARFVHNIPPFPNVKNSFEAMQGKADIVIVSQTPHEALVREWEEHGIAKYVKFICGQEIGTKAQCIGYAMENGYDRENVLMIGDAPGDFNSAKDNDVMFFPISPIDGTASWNKFYSESFAKLLAGEYKGAYENALIDEYNACLPECPPWE